MKVKLANCTRSAVATYWSIARMRLAVGIPLGSMPIDGQTTRQSSTSSTCLRVRNAEPSPPNLGRISARTPVKCPSCMAAIDISGGAAIFRPPMEPSLRGAFLKSMTMRAHWARGVKRSIP